MQQDTKMCENEPIGGIMAKCDAGQNRFLNPLGPTIYFDTSLFYLYFVEEEKSAFMRGLLKDLIGSPLYPVCVITVQSQDVIPARPGLRSGGRDLTGLQDFEIPDQVPLASRKCKSGRNRAQRPPMKPQRGAMFVDTIAKTEKELRRSGIVSCHTGACPCRTYGAQALISRSTNIAPLRGCSSDFLDANGIKSGMTQEKAPYYSRTGISHPVLGK